MSGRRRSAVLLITAKWLKDESRRTRLSSQTQPACERASARCAPRSVSKKMEIGTAASFHSVTSPALLSTCSEH